MVVAKRKLNEDSIKNKKKGIFELLIAGFFFNSKVDI